MLIKTIVKIGFFFYCCKLCNISILFNNYLIRLFLYKIENLFKINYVFSLPSLKTACDNKIINEICCVEIIIFKIHEKLGLK